MDSTTNSSIDTRINDVDNSSEKHGVSNSLLDVNVMPKSIAIKEYSSTSPFCSALLRASAGVHRVGYFKRYVG